MVSNVTHARRGSLLAAVAAGLLWAGASGAAAQTYYEAPRSDAFLDAEGPLPPRAVVARLYDRGFTEIDRPRFDGDTYVVDATDPGGARVRLYVDAQDGTVVGRRRLDGAFYPRTAPGFRAAGYGWTEDEAAPRSHRETGRLLPPADIPEGLPAPLRGPPRSESFAQPEAAPRFETPSRAAVAPRFPERPAVAPPNDPNPLGLNPDAPAGRGAGGETKGRGEVGGARNRSARLAPPAAAKPAASQRATPEAPTPRLKPAEDARAPAPQEDHSAEGKPVEGKPVEAAPTKTTHKPAAGPKTEPAKTEPAKTDAANAETQAAASKSAPRPWREPPPAEGGERRNVRVIGGATVVPGTSDNPPESAN